jgi:hypothetical protein
VAQFKAYTLISLLCLSIFLLCSCGPWFYSRSIPAEYRQVFEHWKELGCASLAGYSDDALYEMYMWDISTSHHQISYISSCLAMRETDTLPLIKRQISLESNPDRLLYSIKLLEKMVRLCRTLNDDQELMQLLDLRVEAVTDAAQREHLRNWIGFLHHTYRPEDCQSLRESYERTLWPARTPLAD